MNLSSKNRVKTVPVSGGVRNLSPKTMAMIVLLTVMGILWGRVLLQGESGPAQAEAMEVDALQQATMSADSQTLKIQPVSLPELPGRNDRLASNFFSSNNWQGFGGRKPEQQDNDYTINDSNESIEQIQQLKLQQVVKRLAIEAIIEGTDRKPFRAFVDGKILSVGDTLTVQEGPDQYVLIVEKISKKEVVFTWKQVSVVLKVPESFEF